MAPKSIVALLVADDPDDAALISKMMADSQTIAHQPISILLNHVKTLREARDYLSGACHCDVVLFDLSLPDSADSDAIGQMSLYTVALPTILLMGFNDVVAAGEALKRGCQDCLVKSELNPALLSRAVYYAAERFKVFREERENSIAGLQKTLGTTGNLNGLIPICMHCKQVKNDKGDWEQLEVYIRLRFHVKFWYGICPECAKVVYGLDENDRNGCKPNSFIPVSTPDADYGCPSMNGV